ncbi:LRR receptor-like serine/threonine-protein kinase EFR [Rhododendron vialii]|uniref:LRR receptor-like serine/threonine-protein kinase EFR n=1 Tax=Rhododendron vialii TaxID=182163 RepID=UPI00265E0837|nr:LRR receptor-like serine/threonine-protein kinase EFR [Rhododendron vialii]
MATRTLWLVLLSLTKIAGKICKGVENSKAIDTTAQPATTKCGNFFISGSLTEPQWLQKLDLCNKSFKGTIPTSLSHCLNLMYLNVARNKLVGEFLKELAYSMPRLIILYLRENNLTGGIPPSIENLTSLENFGAVYTPFGGIIPNALGQLKYLTFLGLGGTQISGTIPPSLYNLSLLDTLSLFDNRLSGSLPLTFAFIFPELRILRLYVNQFNGPIRFQYPTLRSW